VVRFKVLGDGILIVAYNDKKTDVAKISQALEKGRFQIKGTAAPADPTFLEETSNVKGP